MSEWKGYNKIEFEGSMLRPSFSVYLFEIKTPKEDYFYIGMTGDGYYPSARSALHRLSGHFEKKLTSTQNQVSLALRELYEIPMDSIKIVMHHWPIEGFAPWNFSLRYFTPDKLEGLEKEKYETYKSQQQEVLKLEQYLIMVVKSKVSDRCLNETTKKQLEFNDAYKLIIEEVNKIVK